MKLVTHWSIADVAWLAWLIAVQIQMEGNSMLRCSTSFPDIEISKSWYLATARSWHMTNFFPLVWSMQSTFAWWFKLDELNSDGIMLAANSSSRSNRSQRWMVRSCIGHESFTSLADRILHCDEPNSMIRSLTIMAFSHTWILGNTLQKSVAHDAVLQDKNASFLQESTPFLGMSLMEWMCWIRWRRVPQVASILLAS